MKKCPTAFQLKLWPGVRKILHTSSKERVIACGCHNCWLADKSYLIPAPIGPGGGRAVSHFISSFLTLKASTSRAKFLKATANQKQPNVRVFCSKMEALSSRQQVQMAHNGPLLHTLMCNYRWGKTIAS